MNYVIPIKKREVNLSQFGSLVAYVDVFGKGVKVIYKDKDSDLSPLNISQYLLTVSDQSVVYIEADDPEHAIEVFYNTYEDATSCGLESQAIEISKRMPIEELPGCPFMKYNRNGHTVCIYGDEERYEEHMQDSEEECESFGCGCVIDFADEGPSICPIENTREMFSYDFKIEEHKGFQFKRLKRECITAEKIAENNLNILKEESAIRFGSFVAEQFLEVKQLHKKLSDIFKELKLEWPQLK